MWKFLKADFQYNKVIITVALSLTFIAVVGDIGFGLFTIDATIGISLVLFFITIGMIGANVDSEKRERLRMLCPVSISRHSIERILFIGLYLLCFVTFWVTSLLIKYQHDSARLVPIMIFTCAYGLSAVYFFVIYSDLKYYGPFYIRILYLIGVFVLLFTLGILTVKKVITFPMHFGQDVHVSVFNMIFYSVLAVCLIYLDHQLFIRKKYFIE